VEQGWIKLYRRLQDSEIWVGEKFTRGQAWVDMLLMANHKDKTIFIRGNEIRVKRGQIARAERTISEKWGWSRDKLRRFFTWLETRQQITQQKSKLLSIVTIVNYEEYQQNDTTDKTTEKPQTRPQKNLNKNEKNEKNEKKKENKVSFVENSIEFRLSQKLFNQIKKRNENYKAPNLQTWAKEIDKMIRIDKRDPDQISEVITWCQEDDFWQNNILSTVKLRKQYDQLVMKMPEETQKFKFFLTDDEKDANGNWI